MNESNGHNDKVLKKWLEGTLSQAEWDQYKISSGRSEQLEQMERLASHAESWNPPKPKLSTSEAWESLQNRISTPTRPKVIPLWQKPWVAGIAASLLLVFCIWFYWGNSGEEVYSPQGINLSHSLPDNSSILLNADSKITYELRGFKKERLVRLQGEAFFEVSKGSTFVVASEYGEVTVLGTSFNVYSRNDKFEVACSTGRVQVSVPGETPIILTPGMVSTFENEELLVSNSLEEKHLLDWQQGEFYFKNTPLPIVLQELQRQLNLHIVHDHTVDDMIYTGFFNRKDPNAALQSVLEPMGLNYQIHGDTVKIE